MGYCYPSVIEVEFLHWICFHARTWWNSSGHNRWKNNIIDGYNYIDHLHFLNGNLRYARRLVASVYKPFYNGICTSNSFVSFFTFIKPFNYFTGCSVSRCFKFIRTMGTKKGTIFSCGFSIFRSSCRHDSWLDFHGTSHRLPA